MDKVAVGQALPYVLWFVPLVIILPNLQTSSFILHDAEKSLQSRVLLNDTHVSHSLFKKCE